MFVPGIELAVDKGTASGRSYQVRLCMWVQIGHLGRIVIIEHDKACATLYGRLGEIGVKAGQEVAQGQVIGTTARDLFSLSVQEGEQLVDPLTRIQ